MSRLTYQYAGRNACHGTRFEQAFDRAAARHKETVAELARVRSTFDPDEGPTTEKQIAEEALLERVLRAAILAEYGDDASTVAEDIYDLCFEAAP